MRDRTVRGGARWERSGGGPLVKSVVSKRRSRLAVQRDRAVGRRFDPQTMRFPDVVVGFGGADEAALALASVPVVRADLVGGEPPRVAGLDDPGSPTIDLLDGHVVQSVEPVERREADHEKQDDLEDDPPGASAHRLDGTPVHLRAPSRRTAVELLLRDDEDEGWTTRYRSQPERTEPVPTGHNATQQGRWRDGLPEGMEAVSSHATLGVAMPETREKFPRKPRSERFGASKAVLRAPI